MRCCLFRTLSIAALLLVGTEAPAQNASTGTINGLSPTMTVVEIDEPDCGRQGGIAVHYDPRSFNTLVSGNVIFTLSDLFDRAAFYAYRDPFNPALGRSTHRRSQPG